ncbi:MAG: sensor histidine kinase [Bacteroidota bacterium]
MITLKRLAPRTITARITAWYVVSFGIILVAFSLFLYLFYARSSYRRFDAMLLTYATSLAAEVGHEGENDKQLSFEMKDLPLHANDELGFTIVELRGVNGKILASSVAQDTGILPRSPIISAKESAQLPTFFTAYVPKFGKCRIVTLSLEEEGYALGKLVVAASLAPMEGSLRELRLLLLIVLPGALAITVGGGYIVVRRSLRPVRTMVAAASRISGSNIDQRLPLPTTGDELSQLANAFNQVLDRIDQVLKSQRRFIADASHELRTPLTIVQGELEHVLSSVQQRRGGKTGITKKHRHSIAIALEEITRVTAMANNLLYLSRLDAEKDVPSEKAHSNWKVVSLADIIVDAAHRGKALAAKRKQKLSVRIDSAAEIFGDEQALVRALLNLIDNAVKFSPPHSSISLNLFVQSNEAIVEVKDQGIGIASDELTRIFDRFYRSSSTIPDAPGAGLGLAIVKAIVENHGGRVEVESSAERHTRSDNASAGSIFRLFFPIWVGKSLLHA